MSMYGKYPKVLFKGELVEQNGLNGAPHAWPTTDCSKDVRLTVQAPREEVDINRIMQKVERGMMLNVNALEGRFEDVSEFDGLEAAVVKVQKAREAFMELPADLRSRFDNDPVKLVDFLSDGKNRKEAEELGLLVPKPVDKGPGPATIQPDSGKDAQKST